MNHSGKVKPYTDRFDPVAWNAIYSGNNARDFHFRRGATIAIQAAEKVKGVLLDVGCGTGHTTSCLAGSSVSAVGIDHDLEMLRFAKRSSARTLYSCADAARLPLKDNSCNALLAVSVLGCLDSPVPFVREAHRVLHPGGLLILTCTNDRSLLLRINGAAARMLRSVRQAEKYHLYDATEVETLLVESGFQITSLRFYNFFLNPASFVFPPRVLLPAIEWIGRYEASAILARNFLITAVRS